MDHAESRISAATTAFHARWLELLRDQPGNPSGVDLLRLAEGRIVGTVATELPEVEWLQHVCGLQAGDDEEMFELATWYAELEAWPRYEIPVDAEDELIHTLLAVEAKPTGALAVLAAPAADLSTDAAATDATAAGTDVVAVEAGSPEVAAFAEAIMSGHEVPDGGAPDHLGAVAAWVEQDGWSCFVAERESEVVGAAALLVLEGVGYLANAATVPEARGHGVHTALIAARVDAAQELGCDLVCAIAEPDSPRRAQPRRAPASPWPARAHYWTCSP